MKRLFWTVIVLALCVVGLGFYRGWFVVSSHSRETGNHKIDVNLTVEPEKMKEDAEAVKDRTKELTGQETK